MLKTLTPEQHKTFAFMCKTKDVVLSKDIPAKLIPHVFPTQRALKPNNPEHVVMIYEFRDRIVGSVEGYPKFNSFRYLHDGDWDEITKLM